MRGLTLSLMIVLTLTACRTPARPPSELVQPAWEKIPADKRDSIREGWEQANQSPGDAGMNGRLGMLLLAYDQPVAAASALSRAVDQQPDSFPWLYYLGQAQAASGQTTAAIATLKRAGRHHAAFVPLQLKLAALMKLKVDDAPADPGPDPWMDAIRDLRPPEKAPDLRIAHFDKGRELVAQKKFAAGIEELKQTLAPVDGETPGYLYALSKAYALAGDGRNAMKFGYEAKYEALQQGKKTLAETIEADLKHLEGNAPSKAPARP